MRPPVGFERFNPWYSALRVISGGGGGAWSPDDVLAGVTNSFWSDPLAGTLYEDAGLTTLADATNDPVGGVRNLSAIGTSTLSQSTTASKMVVASDGRVERTINGQFLQSSAASANSKTICIAMDVESLNVNGTPFFGAGLTSTNVVAMERWGTKLFIKVGSASWFDAGIMFSSTINRRRIIMHINNSTHAIYLDGELVLTRNNSAGWTVGVKDFLLGRDAPLETAANAVTFGRVLVAQADLSAYTDKIDAWLGGA
jgi:hypothetical protein